MHQEDVVGCTSEGISYKESDILNIHVAGCHFIKGFEAHNDEKLIQLMDEGSAAIQNFVTGPMIDMSNTFGITSAFVPRTLINHKRAWQELKNTPQLIQADNVIQEIFRMDNHVKVLSRQALDDVDLPGYSFEKGPSVSLFFPGLNRDPAQWENPNQLEFNRVYNNKNNFLRLR